MLGVWSVAVQKQALDFCRPCLAALIVCAPAHGAVFSYVSVDMSSRQLLAAEMPDQRIRPASLAKLMTVHVILLDIAAGRLKLSQRVAASPLAAAQLPVRVGLKAGRKYLLSELLSGAIIRSGNDAAVALAEAGAGTEEDFVVRMNQRAGELGLRNTRFANASGLPADNAYTSARDVARLVLAIAAQNADYSTLFMQRAFHLGKVKVNGHNRWLSAYKGADGMKTGFTCRAGYHLAATATKLGRRLAVVVLGASTSRERLNTSKRLMDAAFGRPPSGAAPVDKAIPNTASSPVPGAIIAASCKRTGYAGVKKYAPSGWSIALQPFAKRAAALKHSRKFIARFIPAARPFLTPRLATGLAYQAGATGLSRKLASKACLSARKTGLHCVVQSPVVAHLHWKRAVNLARRSKR
jgi:D-alanyl-D-alanine carboxypeptidase